VSETIKAMRAKTQRRTFLSHADLKRIRVDVLRCSQQALASQLLNPATGLPINQGMVSRWELGERPVPLWAARHIRLLEEAAQRHDSEGR
jgi:hypothetical protein